MAVFHRRVLLVLVALLATASIGFAQAEKVYVTKTGEKYHRESCKSLSKSKIEISLREAAARYGPCKNCQPPTLATKADAVPAASPTPTSADKPATAAPKSAPATAGRCQATTKKGTQCSRNAQAGRSYCWQH